MSRVMVFLSACTLAANAAGRATDAEIDSVAKIFHAAGVVATFIVSTTDGKTIKVYNDSRSSVRFSPASTFKIPNTLIALDAGFVTSKGTIFTWDGKDKGLPRWNQDQTLESAFKVSCVWCYQKIARKVGAERYGSALATLDYGNQSIGNEIDRFWLNGELRISAREQIEFLGRLYNYTVPFRREYVDILKDIMLTERTDSYSIYAKSGWAATTPQVGWYVGFVTKHDESWLFAMNMQVDRPEQVALRVELTHRALRVLKIIE